jgi:hypothetical protein
MFTCELNVEKRPGRRSGKFSRYTRELSVPARPSFHTMNSVAIGT